MNNAKSTLDTCGCCDGVELLTPANIDNDHGLTSLRYRIGTHGLFKESMLRSLTDSATLKELTIREDDDATIAMIDAWAVILDVLTFYNERIINEGYILTSRERLSLVELARHISYIPKPGVAAGSWLSFLTDESPGAPTEVKVPVATKVQSIPGQDEKAQVFETIENIQIKTKWNAISPKLTQNQILTTTSNRVYLAGTTTLLQQGDYLLIVDNEREGDSTSKLWDVRVIETVDIDSRADHTLVTWQGGLDHTKLLVQKDDNENTNAKIYALRQRASIFGYNAPDYRTMSEEVKKSFNGTGWDSDTQWDGFELPKSRSSVDLDAFYPKILQNSWVVLVNTGHTELFRVSSVVASAQDNFALATKSSRLTLDTSTSTAANFQRRDTLVLAQSEELTLAKAPISNSLFDTKVIELDRDYPELEKGQKLIISGELALEAITSPDQETQVSEWVEIESFATKKIILKNKLNHRYQRKSVKINANIAQATHGETKIEILGSGNAALPFQKFYLKQKPLTYITAASSTGIATTLEVRVDDILWKEVSTFYDKSSEERIYISRIEDDGTTYVQFGNGITGTRLPSGVDNIKATYRVGIGLQGILKAQQLSLLLSPQLGIKSVSNPLPTAGAEDPEALDDIKHNAPLTVLTLDRIVSLLDYENFTSAFAGIGKARADLLWKGEDRIVHLTVASANEGVIDATLETNLRNAINAARHNNYPVVIQSFIQIAFNIKSKIRIHPDYLEHEVITAVKETLMASYNFKMRSFGQAVPPSEVIATIQSVEGVIAVDLDELGGQNPFSIEHFRLSSNIARWDEDEKNILPAELLLINEAQLEIIPMKP